MVFCVFCNQSIIPVKIPVTTAYKTRRRPKVINQSWQLNPQLNLQQGWYALDFDKELRKREKKITIGYIVDRILSVGKFMVLRAENSIESTI